VAAKETLEWLDKSLWKRIQSRWDEKENVYARLKKSRKTIQEFFRPDMDSDVGDSHDANLLGHDIYEGTAPWAALTMAIGFQSASFSKAIDWIDYNMSAPFLRDIDELDQWVHDIRDHNSEVYKHGNFYDVQQKYTLDAVTIGSPVNFGEEDPKTHEIMWIRQHYSTYRLFYDRYNRPEGIITKEKNWSVKRIYDKFCPGRTREERMAQAREKLSVSIQTAINGGNWSQQFLISRAVFKIEDPLWYNVNNLPVGGQTWVDCYFEEQPRDEDKPLLIEGYFSKPFVVWDYDKNPWESASRTPAYEAVYDNATLQQIFLNWIENVQMRVRPAMKILAEQRGRYDFGPGGENLYDRSQWNYTPEVIQTIGDVNLEEKQAKMLTDNLKRHFHTPLFNVMTEIAITKTQPLTATQILEIKGEKITMLAPMIESNDNYLRQVDDRVMSIEIRAGRGPFDPATMERMEDIIRFYSRREGLAFSGEVVPEFVGELRRTQQMKQRLTPIRLGLEGAAMIGEVLNPDLPRLAIRGYSVLKDYLQAVNFPMINLREEDEYDEGQAMLDESRAKQLEVENTIEAMKASKGLNQAIEPNSPAALMAGAPVS
jgi:hypothetical protein